MVDIELNVEQVEKLKRTVGRLERGIPRALAPAINRALAHGKTVVTRQVRKEYLIDRKDIPVTVDRATYGKLQGQVNIVGTMIDLNKFKIRPKYIPRKQVFGVFAQVKKGKGAGGNMKGAFLARMSRSGYTGPFIRAAGAGRLPIHKLITISPAIMASQPEVGALVNKEMGDTLAKRLDHEIDRIMATAER